ncbi:hypothetical protein LZZ90_03905 [Flavobacterium sp. SM15]|uniref:hypothetical protein n=1 Tax=Flavobacterium sp. SM15 TaxID=2908005 RepID=UPI001EDC2DC8|nr:hypothetical protein [Flavobacterium sp. SM15]MCG2610645.1 hypothetical protein [Flavobacterium sp. SM15]
MNNDGTSNEKIKLTIEELRKFKGFEAVSDSDAENIIDSLAQLAIIAYNLNIEENGFR